MPTRQTCHSSYLRVLAPVGLPTACRCKRSTLKSTVRFFIKSRALCCSRPALEISCRPFRVSHIPCRFLLLLYSTKCLGVGLAWKRGGRGKGCGEGDIRLNTGALSVSSNRNSIFVVVVVFSMLPNAFYTPKNKNDRILELMSLIVNYVFFFFLSLSLFYMPLDEI